ncbi:MAG: FkbM family methyltransferase [Saprospiraceae bacterium]
MINLLKRILRRDRTTFSRICKVVGLDLDFSKNRNAINVLKAIFEEREYADYFPFYKKVTIVDIGAHYGYFSLFAAKNTSPYSTIFSLEPSQQNYNKLKQNLSDCNIQNVKPFQLAIGGENGTLDLFTGRSINHSLIENYALLGSERNTQKVEVKTLEQFILENKIEKIDFLKIDCEGAEYAILFNTPDYIFDKISTISMEFHDMKNAKFTGNEIVKKLERNGFEVVKFGYEKTGLDLNYGKIVGRKNGII